MREKRMLLATMAALALLGACGEPGSTDAGPGSSGRNQPSSPDAGVSWGPGDSQKPGDAHGSRMVRAQLTTPTPGLDNVLPSAIGRVKVASDDRSVLVHFWSGPEPCYALDSVKIVYRSEVVLVTPMVGSDPDGSDEPCPEYAELKAVRVELHEPLDGRAVKSSVN